jgi:hypothetical protein
MTLEDWLAEAKINNPKFSTADEAKFTTTHERLQAVDAALATKEASLPRGNPTLGTLPRRPRVIKTLADFTADFGKDNKIITSAVREAARARQLERAGRLNAGVDPTAVADLAIELGYFIEGGARMSWRIAHQYLTTQLGATSEEAKAAFAQAMNGKRSAQAAKVGATRAAGLAEDVAAGKPLPQAPPIERSPELLAIDAQTKDLRAQLQEIKNGGKSPQQIRLARSIQNLISNNAKMRQEIIDGTRAAKQEPIQYDNEWVKLKQESLRLRAARDKMAGVKEPLGALVYHSLLRKLGVPNAWILAWDDSAVLRQGLKMLTYRPRTWGRMLKGSLRALGSEEAAWTIAGEIENNPNFAHARTVGKIDYSPLDPRASLASMDEAAMYFNEADSIPVLGRTLRPFGRAMNSAVNIMRFDPYYRMLDAVGTKWTPEHYKSYGALLLKLTGRGDLGRAASWQPELSGTFISIRNMLADVQQLITPLQGPKAVKIEATRALVQQYAALAAFGLVVNAAADKDARKRGLNKRAFEVGLTNPDSVDWLQLRIGNTRFGLTGTQRTLFKAIWKAGQSAWAMRRGQDVKYGQEDPVDKGQRYLGVKVNPAIRAPISLYTGKGFGWRKGDPMITPLQVGRTLVEPAIVQGMIQAWQTDGAGLGLLAGVADFWGIGSNTFVETPKKPTRPTRQRRATRAQ